MLESHPYSAGRLRVTVNNPTWPDLCACCSAPAETAYKLKFEQFTRVGKCVYSPIWDVPYCKYCLAHVDVASKPLSTNTGSLPALGSLAALVGSVFIGAIIDNLWPLYLTAVLLCVVVQGPVLLRLKRARAQMKTDCSAPGPAVRCLQHTAHEGVDAHVFEFTNSAYAREFQVINAQY